MAIFIPKISVSVSFTVPCDRRFNRECFQALKCLHQAASNVHCFCLHHYALHGLDGHGTFPELYLGWSPQKKTWTFTMEGVGQECSFQLFAGSTYHQKVMVYQYLYATLSYRTNLSRFGEEGALKESVASVMAMVFGRVALGIPGWKKTLEYDFSAIVTMNDFKGSHDRPDGVPHVLYNSQIPSHVFYKTVQGYENMELAVAKIWMQAALGCRRGDTFSNFAHKTTQKVRECLPFLAPAACQAWKTSDILARRKEGRKEWDLNPRYPLRGTRP